MSKLDPRTFPRPPKLERIAKDILIKFPGPQGPTIARTKNAYWVLETFHPPTYYIPPSDIQIQLNKTPRRTFCEWKGAATYFAFKTPDGQTIENRAWTYEAPTKGFQEIKDYLCFYADTRWECIVDGETVEPQPGDFYGGWLTRDIDRTKVKGGPGTLGW